MSKLEAYEDNRKNRHRNYWAGNSNNNISGSREINSARHYLNSAL